MAMDAGEIQALIKEGLPDAHIEIRDLAGDGDHFAAVVISESFRGEISCPAASDGLSGAEGQNGRRFARIGAADICS